MGNIIPNKSQQKVIDAPLDSSIFLSGVAGTGKTTTALFRLQKLLREYPGYKILIITPQLSLSEPYQTFLSDQKHHQGSLPTITTISGLSRDFIRIFWPLISEKTGFKHPRLQPHFLSLETAQFCMARIVDPLLEKGYFQSVTIDRNRLFSQIIDNLNKSAIYGVPIDEIANRLKSTSYDTSTLDVAFDQVQECSSKFRKFCLENNLIDFSLLLASFRHYILPLDIYQDYLSSRYDVLIADNIEEDTLFAHQLFSNWIDTFSSSLFIFDVGGGFRSFLGANPSSSLMIKDKCREFFQLTQEFNRAPQLIDFRKGLAACIKKEKDKTVSYQFPDETELNMYHFYPEMISETCLKISRLIDQGTHPQDIVILSPYLSDSLKFSLTEKLQLLGIPTITSRPSRMYISSPEIKAMLTFAKLAHPQWDLALTNIDFRNLIMEIIPDMDIIRAELIAKSLFSKSDKHSPIRSFDNLKNIELQNRISFVFGEKMVAIRNWLNKYIECPPLPLDVFFQVLFGELISQKEFKFHDNYEAANNISRLIRSIKSFRIFSYEVFKFSTLEIGKEYIQSAENGLIPGAFSTHYEEKDAILIAPAFTFLMKNRSVDYQFWLDIGNLGWWERLYQPLTNPYVFDKEWKKGLIWDEKREFDTNQAVMLRLINGLLSRCNRGVISSAVKINEFGSENNGPLLQAFQNYKKRHILLKREI
ncbi:MAG: hypothetical protein J7L66_04880 [Anaerolineaceae bacterium]|nr:hypothetical protein [Anaerolineaceae bacterium]